MTFERLRLTPKQLALAVAMVLVLAANLYFGVTYVDTRQQQRSLNDRFHALEASLQRLVSGQRGSALSDGEGVGALAFPPSLPGVELTDIVICSARDSGVEVLSLRSVAVPNETIGVGTYRAVRVDLGLRTDRDRLIRFFDGIERSNMRSLVVDDLIVTSDGGRDEVGVQITAYATTISEGK